MFDSKNKLHEHLRNRECTAAILSSSITKSIAPHKSSLSALTPAESTSSEVIPLLLSSPLPEYRTVSSLLPTYETVSKNYLTVADLYMRYAPLKSVKSSRSVATRFMAVPILIVKDLYEKFHGKKKPAISTAKCASDSSVNQNPLLRNSKCRSEASISSAKTHFFIKSKSIAQSLDNQQQRHMAPTTHVARDDTCVKTVRRYGALLEHVAVAIGEPIQFQTSGTTWRKPLKIF